MITNYQTITRPNQAFFFANLICGVLRKRNLQLAIQPALLENISYRIKFNKPQKHG